MKTVIQHPVYGEIVYKESAWTGKKEIIINGARLKKINKTTFAYTDGVHSENVILKGNFLTGTRLCFGKEVVVLTPAAKWYEYLFAVLTICLPLVWGNSPTLCSILPIVGGAIGGAIGGAMAIVNLMSMKSAKSVGAKMVIGIIVFIATLLICYFIASAFISIMTI